MVGAGRITTLATVREEVLENPIPPALHEIRLSIRRPLVIEESARSGLFGVETTAAMLVLARDMRTHDLYLREATCLEPHMDRAWAQGFRCQAGPEHGEFFRLCRRYVQAARMVQLSEESIVTGCEEVLEELH